MTLYEWTKDALKNGPELFRTEVVQTNDKGVIIKRDTTRLREISLGVISSNSAEEWYRICRLNCPVGTTIEDYTEDWIELYTDTLALVRNSLTKSLLQERSSKSAATLLSILERRDKEHWQKESKATTVDINKDTNDIRVKFEVVGG